ARRLCYTASSPNAIAVVGLRFATLGGKYLWRDFHPLELCHARHTKKAEAPGWASAFAVIGQMNYI
ncbi:MAG: hypothetical protein IKE00_02565, partial [Oscillospiraceae bacterium]|nr:hypothetical protein [Oscillospiraceae bacterium]